MSRHRLIRRAFIQRTALASGGAVLLAACQQVPPATPAAPVTQPPVSQPTAVAPAAAAPTAVPTTAATSGQSDPRAVITKLDRTGWPKTFIMGFFGGDDPNQVLNSYTALAQFLSGLLKIEFKAITGTSYSAVIEAMRTNHADSMEVGPFSYILAVQEAHAEALVADVAPLNPKNPKFDPSAKPYYYSMIITKKGNGIGSLADLKGKTFSFVDPASTSGHLMPTAVLMKAGLNPDKDLKTIYAGSHPTSVLAVWNGKVDAGATFDANLYQLSQQGQVELCWFPDNVVSKQRTSSEIKQVADACSNGKIIILAQSQAIPNTPFAVRSNLPATLKEGLRAALLDVRNHPDLVRSIGEWYVDPSSDLKLDKLDSFYDPLRDVAKLLNLDLKKLGS